MLRWQADHRDRLAQYRAYEEATGCQPDEMAGAPQIKTWLAPVWQAFQVLNGSRQYTMGGAAPIPFSEISAYLQWQQLDRDEADEWLYLIREMDSAFLDGVNKKD